MLINDLSTSNRQEKQVVFQRVMAIHIMYFVNDIFWAGMLTGSIPYVRVAAVLLNFINFILLTGIAMEWFLFAAANTGMKLQHSKKGKWLIRLPFLILVTLLVVAYCRDPLLWLSESGVVHPAYSAMLIVSPMIYIIWASVYSIRQALKKENIASRKLFILIGLYPVEVVFFGILQIVMNIGPLFCFCVTVMMVHFYINNLRDQISIDPLTKLNNRAQLIKYIAMEAPGHSTAGHGALNHIYIMMIDINEFKKINDGFGHAEGDRALVYTAEALRAAGKTMKEHPFIGRYGGDEFILIIHTRDVHEPEMLCKAIRDELTRKRNVNGLPYELSVGIGFDEWKRGEDFQNCMVRADEIMYSNKKQIKTGRVSA